VRRFARRLLAEGLVHNIASDAHDALRRPPGMADDLADAGLGALADWLTRDVPSAILSGEDIPSRPPASVPALSRFARMRRRRD
jgi:protein-tyrosine phosphatase